MRLYDGSVSSIPVRSAQIPFTFVAHLVLEKEQRASSQVARI